MLQLRDEECLPPGIHPCPVRYCRCASLPATLRFDAFFKGYELGYLKVAAIDRRSLVSSMARFIAFGSGTVEGATP